MRSTSFYLVWIACILLNMFWSDVALGSPLLDAKPEIVKAWNSFLTDFNKVYASESEREKRFEIFSKNFEYIVEENEKAKGEYELGINAFADLTNEEYVSKYLGTKIPEDFLENDALTADSPNSQPSLTAPADLDYRSSLVNPIQNQGRCGSCWAFATIAAIESAFRIRKGTLLKFSEQDMVDCDKTDSGCNGGWPGRALPYAKTYGVPLATSYPYTATNKTCKASSPRYYITSFLSRTTFQTPDAIKSLLSTNGVLATALDASSQAFQFYKSGVLTNSMPCKQLNHAVNLVGYATTGTNAPYWIFRNSWGTGWGEAGNFKIRMYASPTNYCYFQNYLWGASF